MRTVNHFTIFLSFMLFFSLLTSPFRVGSQPQADISHSAISISAVQNIILSWSYAVARLALEKTVTLFLADLETLSGSSSDFQAADGKMSRSANFVPDTDNVKTINSSAASNKEDDKPTNNIDRHQNRPSSQHLSPHPQSRPRIYPPPRSSSFQYLPRTTGEAPYSFTPSSSQIIYDQDQRPTNVRSTSSQVQITPRQNVPASALAGIKVLAANRADLYLLQRRLLDHLAILRHWNLSWSGCGGIRHKRWNIVKAEVEDESSSNRSEDDYITDGENDIEGGIDDDDDDDDDRDFDNHILAAMPSIKPARGLYEVSILLLPINFGIPAENHEFDLG